MSDRNRTSSLFGLAPCGVCPARVITDVAVRSYRTFSPLPRRFGRFPGLANGTYRTGGAVCFLWHFPSTGLEPGLPDVIRHTALWSSDFPPSPLDAARATVRSSCQQFIVTVGEAVPGRGSSVVGQTSCGDLGPQQPTGKGQGPRTNDQRPRQFGRFLSNFWIFQKALGRRSLTGGSG